MKTKRTNKLLVLVISLMMIVTLLAGLSITASAQETGTEATTTTYTSPEANEAKIYGANVNLGGDISMKYYVEIGTGIDINKLVLETFFLGEVEALTAAEQTVTIDGHTLYVYTLTSINPQCMGDTIDAKLVYDGNDMEGDRVNKNGYSVKENLENTYKNTSDEKLKELILDTLKYGKYAQIYKYYKNDAFVTDGELADAIAADFDDEAFYNQGYEYTGATDAIYLAEDGGVTVNFGSVNTLKFKYVAPEGSKVTINGEEVTPTKEGDYWVVETKAIAATDFYDLYTVVIADKVTVKYSVNGYSEQIWSNSSNLPMQNLVKALYNYGLSAHIYDGTGHLPAASATCYRHAVCKICWREYGDLLPHNFTYTADGDTITETCDQGCNHSNTITLKAPENLVYDGTAKDATVDGALDAAHEITYNAEPTNVGTYTATLTAGGESVSLEFTITKATATVTAPTPNTLTYTGEAQQLVSAGSTNFGTVLYSLTEDGEFTTTIPTGKDAGTYTVYYYVDGDENHNDSDKVFLIVIILPAPLEITANDHTITYGDAAANNGVTYKGFVNGESESVLSGELTYSYTYEQNDDVGEYTISITGLTSDNYDITFESGTLTVEPVNVNASDMDVVITLAQDSYQYDGTEKKPSVTSITLNGQQIAATNYDVSYTNNTYVGTATVTITFKGNYGGEVTATFEIKQDEATKEYEGEGVTIPKNDDDGASTADPIGVELQGGDSGTSVPGAVVPGTAVPGTGNAGGGVSIVIDASIVSPGDNIIIDPDTDEPVEDDDDDNGKVTATFEDL